MRIKSNQWTKLAVDNPWWWVIQFHFATLGRLNRRFRDIGLGIYIFFFFEKMHDSWQKKTKKARRFYQHQNRWTSTVFPRRTMAISTLSWVNPVKMFPAFVWEISVYEKTVPVCLAVWKKFPDPHHISPLDSLPTGFNNGNHNGDHMLEMTICWQLKLRGIINPHHVTMIWMPCKNKMKLGINKRGVLYRVP